MADGNDNFKEVPAAQQPPDASANLYSDATTPMPKGDQVAQAGDKTTIAPVADYSGEGAVVQARMNVPPEEGVRVAQENVNSLAASISNSPEGVKAAQEGMKASVDFFAQRNPQIAEVFKT